MTDEELIARLRALGRDFDDWDTAADRIEALTAALTAANARADAAEAALAAQIEVDAAIARGHGTEWTHDKETPPGEAIAWCIRNQPHDRIALERLIAKAEADALRKAAAVVEAYDRQDGGAAKAILAEIKGESRD
jgi:hypothetical protein